MTLLGALSGPSASAKTLRIVASFTVLADVVQQVGGSHVQVTSLVPPNGDPHQFEPTPLDAKSLKDADVTFISGEGLEQWFEKLVQASGYQGTPVVASSGIKLRQRQSQGRLSDDPHVWNSVLNVEIWVTNIERALCAADPADSADFKRRAASYSGKLTDMDTATRARIAPIPLTRRKILTSHDAFGYFARDYDVEFLSPIGLSTETEASAADMAKLIDQIKRENVKVYFIENSSDPRLVQQIGVATGAKPGGKLYAESLSGSDGPAATYLQMFRHNVDQIVDAMSAGE